MMMTTTMMMVTFIIILAVTAFKANASGVMCSCE